MHRFYKEKNNAMVSINNSNMNESDDERDLTSLTWLMELRNQNFNWTNGIQAITLNDEEKHNKHSTQCAYEVSEAQQEECDETNGFKYKDNCNNKSNSVMNNRTMNAISNKTQIYEFEKQQGETSSNCSDINTTKRNSIGKSIEKTYRKPIKGTHSQQQQLLLKRATPLERYEMFVEKVKRVFVEYQKSAINYQTDTMEKPPFNYSHIIGMAMLENGRVTLQQICSWIEKKFAFFRVRKKWNNSIRHNLSLHHCFRKIDRKKFEKGKGGYWELGVDPRKCDRKRIRNRKNAQHRSRHVQYQQQAQQKPPLSTDKSNSILETKIVAVSNQQIQPSFNELQNLQTANYYSDCTPLQTNEIQEDRSANCSSALESIVNTADGHLLLDELDIQQNIDVVSCCQQSQQEQEMCITSNADNVTPTVNSTNDNSPQTIELQQNSKQQQYQLGTIIISTPAAKYGSISNFAASTGSINCIINGECIDDKTRELEQNFIYINGNEIHTTCENIIMSPYTDKDDKHKSNCQWDADQHTNAPATFTPFVQYPTTMTKSVSSIFINSVEKERKYLIPHSILPNVVAEQQLEPSGLQYTFAPPLNSTATTIEMPHVTITDNKDFNAEQNNQQLLAVDNIRPYIDGIEEEFQYLRSMDNNREDLLDSFLDISVSDY